MSLISQPRQTNKYAWKAIKAEAIAHFDAQNMPVHKLIAGSLFRDANNNIQVGATTMVMLLKRDAQLRAIADRVTEAEFHAIEWDVMEVIQALVTAAKRVA